MKHFINHDMLAPNVLTVPVDFGIVREFESLARTADPAPHFRSAKPWPKISDMDWITAVSETGFETFQSAFERLGVADQVRNYLDLDRDVSFYAGFLHTRSDCKNTNFHVDWMLTNNEGFTLLTPVCGLETRPKLFYKKLTGELAEYSYKAGEAIIFGDHFQHSSPPGRSDPPVTLLCLNFGTDKMQHWDKLLRTQGHQCPLIRRPDGEFMTVDV